MHHEGEGGFSSFGPDREVKDIFYAYYPRLCLFAYKLVNSRSVAEDLVQDVFLNILGRQYHFKTEATIKAFLYQSVKNACLNALKRNTIKERYADEAPVVSAEDPQVIDNLIRAEVYGSLYAAMQNLPKGCQKVLRLSYFEGLKNDEISKKLNISVNTVKTQKKRGLHLLRLRLAPSVFLFLLLLVN